MLNYKNYFGLPDSSEVNIDTIKINHLARNYDTQIKAYDREVGKQVIVGIKGSGKTDIRKNIEATENAIVFNLNSDDAVMNFDTKQVKGKSGRIKNTLSIELVRSFANYIGNLPGKESKVKKLLKTAASDTLNILKNIPDAVDLDTPIVKVNLRVLLNANSTSTVYSAWNDLIKKVIEALGNNRGYILIDDIEDVFDDIENNIDFLEGLVRAANDINRVAKNKLHVLIFIKYGIWRKWFKNQREMDKVIHLISILSWDHIDLCKLIAYRIANIHKIKIDDSLNVENMWSLEFKWDTKKGFEEFTSSITKYCVCGPRDIIAICNLAKSDAGSDKISIKNIENILKEYSEIKVTEINADFGVVYTNIHTFVELVFQKAPPVFKVQEAAKWIDKNGLTNKNVAKLFNSFSWFNDSSKEKLVLKMYEIGLLGIIGVNGVSTYSIEQPNVSLDDLRESSLTIHPAFHPHLGIK